jgi:hypothetical protein
MDWLAIQKEKLNFHDKTLECEYSEGNTRVLRSIQKHVSMSQISTLQLKKFIRKGCPLYKIRVLNAIGNNELKIKDHPLPWEFKDVFPEEVLGLPKRDLNFSIDLLPGAVSTSKVPYKMSTPEMVELKVQLKEMMDKGYIRLSVSSWGAPILFVKKKYSTL